jgi:anthranilate/para-aminobenzoate synthase component II
MTYTILCSPPLRAHAAEHGTLSRVCAAGSVEVPRLLGVEPHPDPWHLVSDVRGTLSALAGDGDLIRATFPPGSVTGAPKVRAMEIIHELEAEPREVYTGAVGYRSPVAGLELNVAIRTFEFCAGRVWLGSGGGIVADSAVGEEYRECILKAGPLIRAIGGRLAGETGVPAARARDGGVMAGPSLQPRPAAGVFTSPRVADGNTHGLADHVARLEASTRQPFGKGLPPASAPGRRRDRAGPVTVLIDNYDSFTYNLAHMLIASGCRVEVVRNDEVSAQQVASFGLAGVVISPGPCAPVDAGISVDVVRACGGQAPLLGVCLGHQAIAAAFGARIVTAPRPVHGQTSAVTHDGHGFLARLPETSGLCGEASGDGRLRAATAGAGVAATTKTGGQSWRRVTRQRGSHQFHLPSRRMVAGTSRARTTVASMMIAMAMPNPSCSIGTIPVNANAPKTATMSSAAPEISGAVDSKPAATEPVLSPVCW